MFECKFMYEEKQISNFIILNATWIVWKRCCLQFLNYWINNQLTKQWLVASLKFQNQVRGQ